MKIGLVSLGCPKNLVDGEVMLGLAQQAGHEITAEARDADVIVVNTCAFIDNAKQESIDAILEMAQYKRDGKRLVVTGCLAERYRDELKKEIPEIDAVLGTGEVQEIVAAIEAKRPAGSRDRSSARWSPATDFSPEEPQVPPTPDPRPPTSDLCRPTSTTPRRRASPRRRSTSPTSRLPKAATTPARSASSRPCAASIAAGPARRSSPRPGRWRPAASRNCCSSRRTPPSTASTARSAARWRRSCASSTPSTGSSGSGCSTSIRPPSPTTSWPRWPSATRSASTWTCRSSTPRPTSSSGCAGPATGRPTTSCWPGSATAFPASH